MGHVDRIGVRTPARNAQQSAATAAVCAPQLLDIYVDLDGTLLRTDLFVESAWRYITSSFLHLFVLVTLLLRGRAAAKAFLARKVALDVSCLPYESELIAHLRQREAEGHRIVLVTAAHWRYARQVARYLDLFDAVHASSAKVNLKGRAKLRLIKELSGTAPFIYAGDSPADRPIWKASERAIFVNAPRRDIQSATRAELVVRSRPGLWRAFLRAMRPLQWVKNSLLFVPLLTSHTYTKLANVELVGIAFIAFGLCASGHYLLNDLLDLDADRLHAKKKERALARGDLPLQYGALGAIVLSIAAFALSLATLPWTFVAALAGYFVLTNLYSFHFKRHSTLDVMTLAMLYTTRIVAGSVAISVAVSSWLLAFSMFFFVSLAYLKRYIEVKPLSGHARVGGRGYDGEDAQTMFVLGIANATASTIVLALYISSTEVVTIYREPRLLWGLCVLILYWTNRTWVGALRGKIHHDPILFAIKDTISRLIGLAAVVTVVAAQIWP